MRQLRYILILLLFSLPAFAQHEDIEKRESFIQAESEYQIGRIDNAIQTLNKNVASYSGTIKVSAYRLLALCYLAQDNFEDADNCIDLLLKEDPYYSISINDPERFAEIIRNKKEGKTTISTASQQSETLEEAPVPVTLITEEMIRICGARTLKEALIAYVPNMTNVECNEEMNIAMRGIYSSGQEKILIMLNGHRLNSYSTNTAAPDFSISLEKVKQIEVLRGPASSLYGGVALTAVINIITKNGQDVDGIKLNAGIGNYGQTKADFLIGKHYLNMDIAGWASIYHASGQKVNIPIEEQVNTLPVPGDIIIGGYNKKPSFDVGFTFKSNNIEFLYNGAFAKMVAPYSMSYFRAPYSYEKYMKFDGNAPGFAKLGHHADISYDKAIGAVNLKATLAFDSENQSRYQIAGDTVPNVGYNTIIPNGTNDTIIVSKGGFQYHNWQETNWGIAVQGNYQYTNTETHKGNLNFGIQVNKFRLNDSQYLEGDLFDRVLKVFDESKNLYTGNETSANMFMQMKHQWRKNFILNLGIRYDYKKRRNNKTINEYSPRIAFIYLQPAWNVKLSYAKSFVDAPYFYRNNTLDTTTGGEDLLSEYLHAIQLTFAGTSLYPGLNIETNLFYNYATDFIYPNELEYINAGNLKTSGIEVCLSYTKNAFYGNLNAGWQKVLDFDKYDVVGHSIYNIPDFSANLLLSYTLFKKLQLNTHLNFTSKQTMLFKTPTETYLLQTDIPIPAQITWNGNINYLFGEKCNLGFDIHNILNSQKEQGGTSAVPIRQQGAWYTFYVSYKF